MEPGKTVITAPMFGSSACDANINTELNANIGQGKRADEWDRKDLAKY